MIGVHMSIPQAVDQLAGPQVRHGGDHTRQQCITRNVEGHAQPQVARPLVHLA